MCCNFFIKYVKNMFYAENVYLMTLVWLLYMIYFEDCLTLKPHRTRCVKIQHRATVAHFILHAGEAECWPLTAVCVWFHFMLYGFLGFLIIRY